MRAVPALLSAFLVLSLSSGVGRSQDARPWPGFRGPSSSGVADGQGAPTRWDVATGANVEWQVDIPGASNSSPIVWGDRLFVTTAVSGLGSETLQTGFVPGVASLEDLSEHVWYLYAVDTGTGEIVWDREVHRGIPGVMRHPKGSQASSTPATDGERVIVLFGTIGVLAAYDFDGELLWRNDIGVIDSGWFEDAAVQWGHSSSPLIYEDMVIVQADGRTDAFIAAYDLDDGREIWKTARNTDYPSWGTPVIATGSRGDEIIVNGTPIRGYDPRSGEERWRLGPNSFITIPTPIVGPELVYVTGGYQPIRPIYAVRPGATGDISPGPDATSSDGVAWSIDRDGPYIPTPILYRELLYVIRINGVLTAYDADSGEQVYRQRVGTGTFTPSLVAADGFLYIANEEGQVYVVEAGAQYRELAVNEMDGVIVGTPAISGGQMFLRMMNRIYAIRGE